MKHKTKLSLLSAALFMATGASALEVKQQQNTIIFDELDTIQYQAKVRLPNGDLKSFIVNNGDFQLSAKMLGLDTLQNGLYKYELTPKFEAGSLAKDVRALNDAEISAEFAKTYQSQSHSLTGVFTIADNVLADKNLVDPSEIQTKSSPAIDQDNPSRDQQILDDLIVDGSACIGQDCVNGENFGFDTLRLKENNLRIGFLDTSNSASFPGNDWQLTANDSSNGGANKFSIDDISGGRTPFTIEASAPSHSLFVDDGGRIGIGTSTPVVEMHIVNGDSPTLRLEQDGSSGFGAQTWDIAGNETNFFVRDVTNGSQLPFRIRPSAPSNSIYIDTDGDLGLGTASPDAGLHVIGTLLVDEADSGIAEAAMHLRRSDGTAKLLIEDQSASSSVRELLKVTNNGGSYITMSNTSNSKSWYMTHEQTGTHYNITHDDTTGGAAFRLSTAGDLVIKGGLTTGTTTYPDYVFEDDYKLLALEDVKLFIDENGHLPNVPPAEEMIKNGINLTEMHVKLMEKVEELTLYSIKQNEQIKDLKTRIAAIDK